MTGLERLRARIKPGTEVTVVEATWLPGIVGNVYVARARLSTSALRVRNKHNRVPTFFRLQRNERVVEWLDDDTVTWPLPNDPHHRLTLRIGPTTTRRPR